MGCDIHAYIETKQYGNWRWFSDVEMGRNYDLFSLMAGVRKEEGFDCIVDPRGLPEDCGYRVKNEHGGDPDWHTPSWLVLTELNQIQAAYMAPYGDDPYVYLSAVCAAMDELRKVFGGVRLVFWFDN